MVKLVDRALNPNRRKFLDDAPVLSALEKCVPASRPRCCFQSKSQQKQSERPYCDAPDGNSWFEGKLFRR